MLSASTALAGTSPLQPTPIDTESYGETYTLIADLKDGTYVQVQLGVSNIGMGDGAGACRVLVAPAKGKAWTDDIKVERKGWAFRAKPFPSFAVGPCWVRGGAAVEVLAPLKKGKVQITLGAPLSPVKPPDSRVSANGRFYSGEILVPWGPVRAVLTQKGGKALTLQGHGYMDHSRSTVYPNDIARRWVRFRGLGSESSVLLLARFPQDESRVRAWRWDQPAQKPQKVGKVSVKRSGEDDAPKWSIKVEGSHGTEHIRIQRLIYRHAPIEEQGMLGFFARQVVGNPVTYTYRAYLEGRDGSSDKRWGILEVQDVD